MEYIIYLKKNKNKPNSFSGSPVCFFFSVLTLAAGVEAELLIISMPKVHRSTAGQPQGPQRPKGAGEREGEGRM